MKKGIIYFFTGVIIVIIIILLNNKTFFKGSYENIPLPLFSYYKNNNSFYTLRGKTSVEKSINNYLKTLKKCDDSSEYYFDEKLNISIINYRVQKNGLFNVINLDYELGNVCANEFVLKNDWYNNLKIISSEKIECHSDECNSTNVEVNIDSLNNLLSTSKRVDNNQFIDFEYQNDNVYLAIYLKDGAVKLFPYDDKVLGVIYIDNESNTKNALYNIESDINKTLNSLIK